jgi:hypothetical protein
MKAARSNNRTDITTSHDPFNAGGLLPCQSCNVQLTREIWRVVLSREPHLNRSPTQGQNVTRGGQSIDTLRARSLLARVAPADCRAEMSTKRKSNVAPRAPYNIRLDKLSTRMSHTIPASLNKD